LAAKDAVRRFGVERLEQRIGALHTRNERIVAAVLVEEKRRFMLCRLRGQRAAQRRVVDTLRAKDVKKVTVKTLNFTERARIRPSVVIPERCEHQVAACIKCVDASHFPSRHERLARRQGAREDGTMTGKGRASK